MISVLNNFVACKPLGSLAVETTGKEKGFMQVKQKSTLASTEVVFAPAYDPNKRHQISPGNRVYFRADEIGQWLRHVYSVKTLAPGTAEEVEVHFVLVPLDQIKLIDDNRI